MMIDKMAELDEYKTRTTRMKRPDGGDGEEKVNKHKKRRKG